MEKVFAGVVVFSSVSLTIFVGLVVVELKEMNNTLTEILRTNSLKGRYPWDLGMEENKRKAA